jgi:hypothetical protein
MQSVFCGYKKGIRFCSTFHLGASLGNADLQRLSGVVKPRHTRKGEPWVREERAGTHLLNKLAPIRLPIEYFYSLLGVKPWIELFKPRCTILKKASSLAFRRDGAYGPRNCVFLLFLRSRFPDYPGVFCQGDNDEFRWFRKSPHGRRPQCVKQAMATWLGHDRHPSGDPTVTPFGNAGPVKGSRKGQSASGWLASHLRPEYG